MFVALFVHPALTTEMRIFRLVETERKTIHMATELINARPFTQMTIKRSKLNTASEAIRVRKQ
jgi:hypothetical protein